MEEYKNLQIVEDPRGKAGQALTNNFKYIGNTFEDIDSEIVTLEGKIDTLGDNVDNVVERVELNEENLISTSTTLYCDPIGNDETGDGSEEDPWYSLSKAMDYLRTKRLASNILIIIKNGHYNYTQDVNLSHVDGGYITIRGETQNTVELTGNVTYVSGDPLERVYQINVTSTNDAIVGDYVSIFEPREGTNPEVIAGFHEITAISGNTLTILVESNSALTASGAVESPVMIHRSIINKDLQLSNSRIRNIWDIGILGDIIFDNAVCRALSQIGFVNFNITSSNLTTLSNSGSCHRIESHSSSFRMVRVGINHQTGGQVAFSLTTSSKVIVEDSTMIGGCLNTSNSILTSRRTIFRGATNNPVYNRFNATHYSSDDIYYSESSTIVFGCTENSNAVLRVASLNGGTHSIYVTYGSRFTILSDSVINNTTNGIYARHASCCTYTTLTNNASTPINTDASSFVVAY